ncbi:MAG TPA: hypothetical protein VEY90_06340 [Thermoleophilaceae bacterium]|nr:hypothetical protein [Thermoleophilaceae bacterium]
MTRKAYTVLGWAVWQVGRRVAKRKLAKTKLKVGAGATVMLVLFGGLLAARAVKGEDA